MLTLELRIGNFSYEKFLFSLVDYKNLFNNAFFPWEIGV